MKEFYKNLKWYFLILLFMGVMFIWYTIFQEDKENYLMVAFLDVGQGDAIFIEAPNGNQILIDAGPNRKVLEELGKIMPFYDRSINMVIVTHPDNDHIGGLPSVLENYKIDKIIKSDRKSDTPNFQASEKIIEETKIEKILGKRGLKIILDNKKEIYLKILLPDKKSNEWNDNDFSLVTQLIYGKNKFLMTGDISQSIENYLTYIDSDELDSDVLKIGHHGSKTSTSELFIEKVSPEYSIISVEKDNNYGHPHQETLDTLNKFKTKILSTAEEGVIIFKSNGEKLYLK
ncbi:hypothetical protein A2995_00120 [Candidatus Nomurabacteria bacterium RIFCSPLOWO2_01_FULL_33_24]|uniref:Metallo-beta-lactamase domain-containing protein n=1 Tax=Candidatus Nomurabacteria bacterium RIFCSPLOWO2_01_FULL_33_24 TaxID=1801765 RepID=A0A1F6X1Y7_9BACT|nr:MAG: hypothetical protein A2995_00120 [Candidatus Nomurabacteria bacterium RIFCSPLOWO2_01_FULL_33_24]